MVEANRCVAALAAVHEILMKECGVKTESNLSE
jgi:hypothetical protein